MTALKLCLISPHPLTVRERSGVPDFILAVALKLCVMSPHPLTVRECSDVPDFILAVTKLRLFFLII